MSEILSESNPILPHHTQTNQTPLQNKDSFSAQITTIRLNGDNFLRRS